MGSFALRRRFGPPFGPEPGHAQLELEPELGLPERLAACSMLRLAVAVAHRAQESCLMETSSSSEGQKVG